MISNITIIGKLCLNFKTKVVMVWGNNAESSDGMIRNAGMSLKLRNSRILFICWIVYKTSVESDLLLAC